MDMDSSNRVSVKTEHLQGKGDYSKLLKTRDCKLKDYVNTNQSDKSISTGAENTLKPSWKLSKITQADEDSNNSDVTASSCDLWKSSNSTVGSAKIQLSRSNRGKFLVCLKSKTTEKTGKNEIDKVLDSQPLDRGKVNNAAGSPFGQIHRRLPGILTTILSTLMMHLIVASTVILSGRALCVQNEQDGLACNFSLSLKTKLRSLLIKALQVVDDF